LLSISFLVIGFISSQELFSCYAIVYSLVNV